jgi:ribosomal protein L28
MIASLALVAGAAQSAEAREPIRIRVETNALHKIDHRLFGQFLERASWGETGPEIAAGTNGNLSADVVEM